MKQIFPIHFYRLSKGHNFPLGHANVLGIVQRSTRVIWLPWQMCASTAVNASLSRICSTIVETLAKAVPEAGGSQGMGKKVDAMGKEKKVMLQCTLGEL